MGTVTIIFLYFHADSVEILKYGSSFVILSVFDLFFYLCLFICIFIFLGCSLSYVPCHGFLYYDIIVQYHIYLESCF